MSRYTRRIVPEPTELHPATTLEQLQHSNATVEAVITAELNQLREVLANIQALKKREGPLKKRIAVLETTLTKLIPEAASPAPVYDPAIEPIDTGSFSEDGIDLSDFSPSTEPV
jgi:hypothetical protein